MALAAIRAGEPGALTLTFSPLGPASPGVPGKPCGPGSPWKTKTSSSVRERALCCRRQAAGQTAEPGGAAGGGTRNCVFFNQQLDLYFLDKN